VTETALIVEVPEADAAIGRLRRGGDAHESADLLRGAGAVALRRGGERLLRAA